MLIGSFSKPYSVSSGEERKDNKKMLKGPFETHVEKRLMGICAPYRLLTRITASHPVWTHRPLGPVGVRVGDKKNVSIYSTSSELHQNGLQP